MKQKKKRKKKKKRTQFNSNFGKLPLAKGRGLSYPLLKASSKSKACQMPATFRHVYLPVVSLSMNLLARHDQTGALQHGNGVAYKRQILPNSSNTTSTDPCSRPLPQNIQYTERAGRHKCEAGGWGWGWGRQAQSCLPLPVHDANLHRTFLNVWPYLSSWIRSRKGTGPCNKTDTDTRWRARVPQWQVLNGSGRGQSAYQSVSIILRTLKPPTQYKKKIIQYRMILLRLCKSCSESLVARLMDTAADVESKLL